MGVCASAPKTAAKVYAVDCKISKLNRKEAEDASSKIKLLLLGAGESGKSTVFKQMRILYGTGYSDAERRAVTPIVFNNTIASMKALLAIAEEAGVAGVPADLCARFAALSDDEEITPGVADLVTRLWADPGVQHAYNERHRFQLFDSAAYFFERVAELARPGYVPTVEDVLKIRVRTSGILGGWAWALWL